MVCHTARTEGPSARREVSHSDIPTYHILPYLVFSYLVVIYRYYMHSIFTRLCKTTVMHTLCVVAVASAITKGFQGEIRRYFTQGTAFPLIKKNSNITAAFSDQLQSTEEVRGKRFSSVIIFHRPHSSLRAARAISHDNKHPSIKSSIVNRQ